MFLSYAVLIGWRINNHFDIPQNKRQQGLRQKNAIRKPSLVEAKNIFSDF